MQADVTITFGWARMGHVLAAECGQVVLADLTLPGEYVAHARPTESYGDVSMHCAFAGGDASLCVDAKR